MTDHPADRWINWRRKCKIEESPRWSLCTISQDFMLRNFLIQQLKALLRIIRTTYIFNLHIYIKQLHVTCGNTGEMIPKMIQDNSYANQLQELSYSLRALWWSIFVVNKKPAIIRCMSIHPYICFYYKQRNKHLKKQSCCGKTAIIVLLKDNVQNTWAEIRYQSKKQNSKEKWKWANRTKYGCRQQTLIFPEY